MVRQGDIIKVDFNPQAGHEQAGYRPALVISNNFFNQKTNVTTRIISFHCTFRSTAGRRQQGLYFVNT